MSMIGLEEIGKMQSRKCDFFMKELLNNERYEGAILRIGLGGLSIEF
jgi:hypothetical protein